MERHSDNVNNRFTVPESSVTRLLSKKINKDLLKQSPLLGEDVGGECAPSCMKLWKPP